MEQPKRDTQSSTLKRVILLRSTFNQVSGVPRIVLAEARYLLGQGVETHILTYELPNKVRYTSELLDQIGKLNIEEIPHKGTPDGLLPKLHRIYALRKRIREIRPDFIIAQELGVCASLYLATLFTSVPYLAHIHDVPFQSYTSLTKYALIFKRAFDEVRMSPIGGKKEHILPQPPKMGLLKRIELELTALIEYLAIRKAKKLFSLSNDVKWMVEKLYGKEAIVVKGAFYADKLDYRPKSDIKGKLGLSNKIMILNINSLVPEKRIDLLLRAFKLLSAKLEDAVLVIGGIGPEEAKLRFMAQELGLNDRVKFTGYIPEEELWDYYAACDVFVEPFQGDFAIAPYEALALQKKVVVAKELELDEHLLQNRHLFVAEPTAESLAKAINEALNTEVTEKDDMSPYTWEKYVERIHAACQEVIK